MKEELLYQLVKIIKYNGNIWDLINQGYEFGQVTYFIDELRKKDYISTDITGKTSVTSIGEAFIAGFEANNKIQYSSKWIMPRNEMWKKPLEMMAIYIPKE